MFIELHMIQSFSPANLNRDDTNNPKDCEFGGVRRARISSQCIKRAIRTSPVFAKTTRVAIGTRTKWLVELLKKRLIQAGKPEDVATDILTSFVPAYASKLDRDGEKTVVLLYVGEAEIASTVEALLEDWDALADESTRADTQKRLVRALVKAHRGSTSAPDIALFGRMLAEKPVRARGSEGLVAPSVARPWMPTGVACARSMGPKRSCAWRPLTIGPDLALDALSEAEVETCEAWLAAVVEALPVAEADG